jgi:LPXTG-site transpeptidase (sortase) family protein
LRGTIGTRIAWVAAAGAALVLVAGVGTGLLVARLEQPRPAARPGPAATTAVDAEPVRGDSWWTPLPAASAPFVPAELVIERLHLEAPVEVKGVDAHNVMEAPDSPDDAAWYQFTAMPGAKRNAVFAGWRDYGPAHSAAAFLHLDQLATGDVVDVVSARRTEIQYRVTRRWDYDLREVPMQQVLAQDQSDEVTMITSAGTYTAGLGYDRRLVVRAVRFQ